MKEKEICAIEVKPGKHPEIITIANTLEEMQTAVGGLIEIISLSPTADLLCNEEGKLLGLEGNRKLGRDIIAGTFFVIGAPDECGYSTSLSERDQKLYYEKFYTPEYHTAEEVEGAIYYEFSTY